MIKYIGKTCPYCKSTFNENDDIVVCSDCEMPHHKDCWIDNKGCTTFGCQGTIQGIDFEVDTSISSAPKYDVRDTISEVDQGHPAFCAKCGTALIAGNAFCGKCGMPVNGASVSRDYSQMASQVTRNVSDSVKKFMDNYKSGDAMDPELGTYIGTNQEYYLSAFSTLKNTKSYVSWNTFAFLVSPFWCLYRKMYVFGGVILGIDLVLALIGGWIGALLAIGIAVISGLFANYFYLFDLEKRIAKGKSIQEQMKVQYIEQYGDTNATAPSIAAVVFALICVVLFL